MNSLTIECKKETSSFVKSADCEGFQVLDIASSELDQFANGDE